MGFNGFNGKMACSINGFAMVADVHYRKVKAVTLASELQPIARSRDSDLQVRRTTVNALTGQKEQFGYRWVDEKGNEVPADRVAWYVKKGEKDIEVKPYKRGKVFEINGLIPEGREHELLVESTYEVWADDENRMALWKFAEWLVSQKALAVSRFSFGGFNRYLVLLKPIITGGTFIIQMLFCQKKNAYQNIMPIPTGAKAKEDVPTLEELLEVEGG